MDKAQVILDAKLRMVKEYREDLRKIQDALFKEQSDAYLRRRSHGEKDKTASSPELLSNKRSIVSFQAELAAATTERDTLVRERQPVIDRKKEELSAANNAEATLQLKKAISDLEFDLTFARLPIDKRIKHYTDKIQAARVVVANEKKLLQEKFNAKWTAEDKEYKAFNEHRRKQLEARTSEDATPITIADFTALFETSRNHEIERAGVMRKAVHISDTDDKTEDELRAKIAGLNKELAELAERSKSSENKLTYASKKRKKLEDAANAAGDDERTKLTAEAEKMRAVEAELKKLKSESLRVSLMIFAAEKLLKTRWDNDAHEQLNHERDSANKEKQFEEMGKLSMLGFIFGFVLALSFACVLPCAPKAEDEYDEEMPM